MKRGVTSYHICAMPQIPANADVSSEARGLHASLSTQSWLATLLSSLIARRKVGLETLLWFRLKYLSIVEMVGLFVGPTGVYLLDFFCSGIYC